MCKRFPKCLFYGNKKLSLFLRRVFIIEIVGKK